LRSSGTSKANLIIDQTNDESRFLYVDTFKVLNEIHGYECKLYGATQSDLETLEEDLAAGLELCALFTEFPGNPILGSVDLERIERMSDEYNFLFVVDDTVGTSVNVDVISHCDVVCTSLTKMFSGSCNVMGGSVALNPKGRGHWDIKRRLKVRSVNTYFPLDTIVMEENSADFEDRVIKASQNAEHIADILRKHSSVGQVYYPKGSPTQQLYEKYKRPGKGYGYLLSIRFKTPAAAIAFHDALDVAKGPSLGTNFTLGCAYTLFAHYHELDWAEEYGVVEHLVRISVGIESDKFLDEVIKTALDAAERANKK
jgi:cystathionine gamma-synthase